VDGNELFGFDDFSRINFDGGTSIYHFFNVLDLMLYDIIFYAHFTPVDVMF
jgi:hypothetical protein